ncbi:MAG: ribonuclease III, partial [Ornithinimicrobium sp.]
PRDLADLQTYLSEIVGGPCDADLLRRAVTHRSYAYEHDEAPHNERLEFLGDAVLGVIVTDALYRNHPDSAEGQLAKLRAAVVNTRALADVAREAGLGAFVLLGRGEEATGGRDKASILADTTEAVIGCIYLSRGMSAASDLVHHLLDPLMAESAQWGAALDWKTSLQELASTSSLGGPEYVVGSEGPDHDKTFTAKAMVGDEVLGQGEGSSKKAAEQVAAQQAWEELNARATVAAPPPVPEVDEAIDSGHLDDGDLASQPGSRPVDQPPQD